MDYIYQDFSSPCFYCGVKDVAHYHPDTNEPTKTMTLKFIDNFTNKFIEKYGPKKIRS